MSGRVAAPDARDSGLEEEQVELPVVIERLPDGTGFTARLDTPLHLSAEAATAEEAHHRLAALLQRRLEEGLDLRTVTVPVRAACGAQPGWLPNDELTSEWLQQVELYRAECDAADCKRLGDT